jgi:hypothetical protein
MAIWLTTTVQVGKNPKIPPNITAFEGIKTGDLLQIRVGLHKHDIRGKDSMPDVTFINLSNPLKPKHLVSWRLAKVYNKWLQLVEVKD